jgi:hypothetical protein
MKTSPECRIRTRAAATPAASSPEVRGLSVAFANRNAMIDATTESNSTVIGAARQPRSSNSEFIKVSNMNPITSFLVFALLVAAAGTGYYVHLSLGAAFFVAAVLVGASLKMANVWQKFVILRMGKLQSVKGAGLFAIIPVLDSVVAVIDGRIQTTAFNAEQALTKDTVPVNVDAIIFWHVNDAEKAALAITNYREAIDRVAQTSLREMIGSSMLASLLSDRKDADEQLKIEIGRKTAPWGISVS